MRLHFCGGLKILSELLEKHYGTKVVLLIDEYDVPLAKAFENGYYDQMIFLIRSLLEQALKTNDSLKFAVMTGCMRISKESIFTGLNNLKVLSITDERYDEYFGFTDTEVREMLKYYEIEDHYEEVKNWYDGYQFGDVEVYCPWDVLNYCDKLKRPCGFFSGKIIGSTPAVMMPSRNSFKCPVILKPSVRLKLCLPERKS